jgi:hypothetical protein
MIHSNVNNCTDQLYVWFVLTGTGTGSKLGSSAFQIKPLIFNEYLAGDSIFTSNEEFVLCVALGVLKNRKAVLSPSL